jgi:hypothetical protein
MCRLKSGSEDGASAAHAVLSVSSEPTRAEITSNPVRDIPVTPGRSALVSGGYMAGRTAYLFPAGTEGNALFRRTGRGSDRALAPVWQPGRLQDVSEVMLEAYFATLGLEELQLASRAQMQAVRN